MKEIIYLPEFLWDGVNHTAQEHMAVVVAESKISFVGLEKEAEIKYPLAKKCRLQDRLMLPAFIDAHDHGRGISPVGFSVSDRCLEMWLPDLNKLPAIPHYAATYYDGLNLLSSGVATVMHSHNPNDWDNLEQELIDSARGYNDAGIRCILCPLYIDQNKVVYDDRENFLKSLPPEIGNLYAAGIQDKRYTMEAYLELIDRLRTRLSKQIEDNMVQIQLHPNGGQWCSDEALLQMKEYALEHHLKIHMHLLETKYQYIYAKRKWGCSFIKHYHDIGFLGPWVSFAHSVWLDDEDIKLISECGAMVVTNPSSNLRLKSGMVRLKSLIEAGAVVGLGLDGCALDDDQDYLREMRLAWLNMEQTGVDGGLDSIVPLKMATVNGAQISGNELSSGVIKEGITADIAFVNTNKLRHPYADPNVNILELLLQRGTKAFIEEVLIHGEIAYKAEDETTQLKMQAAQKLLVDTINTLRQNQKQLPDKAKMIQAVHEFYKHWENEHEL